jgi:hypothetical protein
VRSGFNLNRLHDAIVLNARFQSSGQSEPVVRVDIFVVRQGRRTETICRVGSAESDAGNLMSEDTQVSRPVLNTYDDIDAAIHWLRRYARSRTELCALVVQYYAVDLDMLAYRLAA